MKIPRQFTVNIRGKAHVLYTGLVVARLALTGSTSLAVDWTYNDAESSLAHAVPRSPMAAVTRKAAMPTPGTSTKGISLHFRRVALRLAKARRSRDALGISECSVQETDDDSGKSPAPATKLHRPIK